MRNPNWKFYPLTKRSIEAVGRVSEKFGRPLTTLVLRRANNKRMREARARIAEALKILVAERQLITINELVRRAGCSWTTVKKHADIWRSYWGIHPQSESYGFPYASYNSEE